MKSVILIRHVKSDWNNSLPDFDRPIRQDRKEDALLIAKEINKSGDLPQYIISSPATRALQTVELLCKRWNHPLEQIAIQRSLYECASRDILAVIKKTDEKYDAIAIVCHNPAITDFVNQYSDTFVLNVPTSGAAKITFEVDLWKDIRNHGKANWILRPKEMKTMAGREK